MIEHRYQTIVALFFASATIAWYLPYAVDACQDLPGQALNAWSKLSFEVNRPLAIVLFGLQLFNQ